MTIGEARAQALGLAEAAEQDHHGIPSWRVRGKIFATVPDAPTCASWSIRTTSALSSPSIWRLAKSSGGDRGSLASLLICAPRLALSLASFCSTRGGAKRRDNFPATSTQAAKYACGSQGCLAGIPMAHPHALARTLWADLLGHSERCAQQRPRRIPRWLLVHHQPLVGPAGIPKVSRKIFRRCRRRDLNPGPSV
jgi:hypothetical protein